MRQYYIGLTRTWQVVLVLVIAPLMMIPFIVLIAMYGPSLPEWVMLTVIYTLMGVGFVATFILIRKVQQKSILTVYNDGFSVEFESRNLFTPKPFEVKINELARLKLGGARGLYYLGVSATVYPFTFNLESRSRKEEDLAAFYEMAEVIATMLAKKEEAEGAS